MVPHYPTPTFSKGQVECDFLKRFRVPTIVLDLPNFQRKGTLKTVRVPVSLGYDGLVPLWGPLSVPSESLPLDTVHGFRELVRQLCTFSFTSYEER